MPRKTIKDKVIEDMYLDAALDLIEVDSGDESEAEGIEMNLADDLHIVQKLFMSYGSCITYFICRLRNFALAIFPKYLNKHNG